MLLYRVENLITNKGLWYNVTDSSESNLVYDLDLSNRTLPMGFDPALVKDRWRSAAESIEQLRYWFTHEDLQKLIPLGFNLYEIDAGLVRQHMTEEYSHPVFQEISVKSRKQLDIKCLLVEEFRDGISES